MAEASEVLGRFEMAKAAGHYNVWDWALFNADGDLIAISPYPTGKGTAQRTVNWLIGDRKDLAWKEGFVPDA